MIEPSLVCKNVVKTTERNSHTYKTILEMNNFSHYYRDKVNKLQVVIEYDDAVIKALKYEGDGEVEHEANTMKITINDTELFKHKRVGLLTYSLLEICSTNKNKVFNAICNDKPFVILKKSEYPPLINDETNEKSLQMLIKKITKDNLVLKLGSTKKIIPSKVEQFDITILKNTYEVITKSFEYMKYEYEFEGLNNATEYSFNIRMKYDDEWYEWLACCNFRTKHGTVGKPTIKIQGIKEDSCNISITRFDGGDINDVELYVSGEDGVVKDTISFKNISINSKFPLTHHLDKLKTGTIYIVNYKVMDNKDGDEKMYYEKKKFKTKKPEVDIQFKRVNSGEALVDVSLLSVKNVSRQYSVVLKQTNNAKTDKLIFDEIPLTKSTIMNQDTTHAIFDVFLNDGETNHLVDKQRIFNIL